MKVFGVIFVNARTSRWTGYFSQRPEHHSIHHQRGLHLGRMLVFRDVHGAS